LKLSLKSDKDPQLVANIAAYVDGKVGEVREMAPTVALDKALMLASLTVAEELFDAQERVRMLESMLRDKVNNCLAVLDDLDAEAH
jgi:cell division protein ZapA (FtsZ GTPase activity inhibitor)